MLAKEEKTNLYLLAIVGIVAVVGIVVLILNSESASVDVEKDLTGEAYKGGSTKSSVKRQKLSSDSYEFEDLEDSDTGGGGTDTGGVTEKMMQECARDCASYCAGKGQRVSSCEMSDGCYIECW